MNDMQAAPTARPAKSARMGARKSNGEAGAAIAPAQLREMIEVAAYYRAERRGFAPGQEIDDWVQAEAEVLAGLESFKGLPA